MKAHRDCPNCSEKNIHVKKSACPACGHVFVKKTIHSTAVPMTARPKEREFSNVVPTDGDDQKLARRVSDLQNHVMNLEKQFEDQMVIMKKTAAAIDLKWKKWYAFQAQQIYQRAFEYFGGQGNLYHDPVHGEKPLFKEIADEEGVFIPPQTFDPIDPPGEPTDQQMQDVAALTVSLRAPVARDLEKDGVIIEDAMSIGYANLRRKEPVTVQSATEHVKFLIGEPSARE